MTRKYGTGSLHQRSDNGRWVGRLPDGRGGHRYVTGTDRDEVRRRLEEMRRERDRMTSVTRGGERLRDVVLRYQATVDPQRNRWKTVHNNAQMARDHILPALGHIRVRQLETADVQRMADRMVAGGLSPRTAGNAVSTLSAILREEMRTGNLERNVASLVRITAPRQDPHPALTTDQYRALLAATKKDPLWPAWALLGTTGLRVGELLGLRWRDIGPDDRTLTISGQYRRIVERDEDGKRTALVFRREEAKTPGSHATIPLPSVAREAIRVQRAQATSAIVVFARPNGEGPMDRAWLSRRFHAALTAHGLPSVRLHSLRSTAIMAVVEASGGNLVAVKEFARHGSIQTTISKYAQTALEARHAAMEAMDRAMKNSSAKSVETP